MNKKHWNTIFPEDIPFKLVYELIDHSYELVLGRISKKMRIELGI
jgi:predicted DNA-binding protein (MmcQ/YjbR family)